MAKMLKDAKRKLIFPDSMVYTFDLLNNEIVF